MSRLIGRKPLLVPQMISSASAQGGLAPGWALQLVLVPKGPAFLVRMAVVLVPRGPAFLARMS